MANQYSELEKQLLEANKILMELKASSIYTIVDELPAEGGDARHIYLKRKENEMEKIDEESQYNEFLYVTDIFDGEIKSKWEPIGTDYPDYEAVRF